MALARDGPVHQKEGNGGVGVRGNFHCYFLMRLQYVLFNYPMRATCFAHLNFYLISLTILDDQYK